MKSIKDLIFGTLCCVTVVACMYLMTQCAMTRKVEYIEVQPVPRNLPSLVIPENLKAR